MMIRIWRFTRAVSRHWGILCTGGFCIGVLNLWQLTGHSVRPAVGWSIGIASVIAACFKAWNEQADLAERAARAGAPKPELRMEFYAEGVPPHQVIRVSANRPIE